MKKILQTIFQTIFSVVFFSSIVLAAPSGPFLVCKSYTINTNAPIKFWVSIDNGEYFEAPISIINGAIKIHYNISYVTNGIHKIQVKAENIWGVSNASTALTINTGRIFQSIVGGKVVQSQIYY